MIPLMSSTEVMVVFDESSMGRLISPEKAESTRSGP
jgi:hypothetical protein